MGGDRFWKSFGLIRRIVRGKRQRANIGVERISSFVGTEGSGVYLFTVRERMRVVDYKPLTSAGKEVAKKGGLNDESLKRRICHLEGKGGEGCSRLSNKTGFKNVT